MHEYLLPPREPESQRAPQLLSDQSQIDRGLREKFRGALMVMTIADFWRRESQIVYRYR